MSSTVMLMAAASIWPKIISAAISRMPSMASSPACEGGSAGWPMRLGNRNISAR